MQYLSVGEFARKWNIPDRTVRNYCANGKIKGAFLTGKTWNIPEDAVLPEKENKKKFKRQSFAQYIERAKRHEAERWYLSSHSN